MTDPATVPLAWRTLSWASLRFIVASLPVNSTEAPARLTTDGAAVGAGADSSRRAKSAGTNALIIVRGIAEDQGTPAQVPDVIEALSAKYSDEDDRQYLPAADPDFDVVYAIRPQSAMMWRLADYERSQRRWHS